MQKVITLLRRSDEVKQNMVEFADKFREAATQCNVVITLVRTISSPLTSTALNKMFKNKHNQEVGSTIESSDERIKVTQEVFTPMELVE